MPAKGVKEIGERSAATIKYCKPVTTGTEPPLDTTHDAGAAGVGIRYPMLPPFTAPITPPSLTEFTPLIFWFGVGPQPCVKRLLIQREEAVVPPPRIVGSNAAP